MEGEIVSIEKVWDNASCTFSWHYVVEFENMPEIKLGKVKMSQ